ncbi:Hypothetical protein FKW44_006887 [Caligus rogercresseyi]|uniref:Uncharacterized protein n=1 Tax=Caligus rogercresseyi TaxID=217165 RepID=A0A7T8KE03_CALRO|nr:Hypothetical protein FKW44_006887 [Caligus rogercresseyi]
MSSTESESISARSAPILAKNNKLLPSPPEESESSLTVLDSESVPAPPEFASLENPAKQPEDTDVDEEDGAIFSVQSILEEPIIHMTVPSGGDFGGR